MNQNSLFLILAAPALAWASGMGLFKTLLLMSAMHRWVPNGAFSGPLEIVGSDAFFYAVLVLGTIEVIVDFIPGWDLAWGRFTAHLRIIGAAILSYLVLYSQTLDAQIMMAIVGAGLALTSFTAVHAARKAATRGRTAIVVRPVAAVTEDCMIAATLLPLTKLPPMTLLMVAFMGLAAVLIMYIVRDETRETLRWVFSFRWTPADQPESDSLTASTAEPAPQE